MNTQFNHNIDLDFDLLGHRFVYEAPAGGASTGPTSGKGDEPEEPVIKDDEIIPQDTESTETIPQEGEAADGDDLEGRDVHSFEGEFKIATERAWEAVHTYEGDLQSKLTNEGEVGWFPGKTNSENLTGIVNAAEKELKAARNGHTSEEAKIYSKRTAEVNNFAARIEEEIPKTSVSDPAKATTDTNEPIDEPIKPVVDDKPVIDGDLTDEPTDVGGVAPQTQEKGDEPVSDQSPAEDPNEDTSEIITK